MTQPVQQKSCLCGCKAPVPAELEAENLCVLHFTLRIENACTEIRRETVLARQSSARKAEISNYIKTTAAKLSEVATGSLRLPDEIKKRILTTFLTLMNLQESIDRAAGRFTLMRSSDRPAAVSMAARG
jgi:hypothetical protein